jgi:hypothetical protein
LGHAPGMKASHSNSAFHPALSPFILAGVLLSLAVAGCSDGTEADDDSVESTGGAVASGGLAGVGGDSTTGGAPATGGAGSGGDSTTGGAPATGGETGLVDYPTDSSQAGIEAFLAGESYKSDPWVGDVELRVSDDPVNPHGDTTLRPGGPEPLETLRTYFNTAAREAKEAGDQAAASMNAMSVKEVYDSADTLVARLVRLKTGAGTANGDWVSYCDSAAVPAHCTGAEDAGSPVYEDGGLNSCSSCHGSSTFLAPLPE